MLFNNRADREFRLGEFLPLVKMLGQKGAKVRVIGENREKSARFFAKKAGVDAEPVEGAPLDWVKSLSGEKCAVMCIGNIKGAAREMIETLSERQ